MFVLIVFGPVVAAALLVVVVNTLLLLLFVTEVVGEEFDVDEMHSHPFNTCATVKPEIGL